MLTGEHPFPETSLNGPARPAPPRSDPLGPRRAAGAPAGRRRGDRAGDRQGSDRRGSPTSLELCRRVPRGARGHAIARVLLAGEIRNPYKGLRAFLEADAADFFGREVVTRRAARSGSPRPARSRFLAVVGPSGSGSPRSFAPGWCRRSAAGRSRAPSAGTSSTCSPASHPLRELERHCSAWPSNPPPSLLDELERDELGLARAVDRLLPDPDAELLIVLDQLEELFTMVEDEDERVHVLASLRAAATDPASTGPHRRHAARGLLRPAARRSVASASCWRLATRRSRRCLPRSSSARSSGPAERVGLVVEPAAGRRDGRRRRSTVRARCRCCSTRSPSSRSATDGRRRSRSNGYRRIGGVSGALARRAEQLFERA